VRLVADHCCPRYTESGEHEDKCAVANAPWAPKPYVKPQLWTMGWEGELAPFFAKLLGL
jgi:hypothetical protein